MTGNKPISPSGWVKDILVEGSRLGARLFRRQVGFGYVADPHKTLVARETQVATLYPGDVLLRQGRPFVAGVKGQADTDGWVTVRITPEMVGTDIAQFVAIEAKTGTGRLTPEQAKYIEVVKNAGGRAGMARDLEDVRRIIAGG